MKMPLKKYHLPINIFDAALYSFFFVWVTFEICMSLVLGMKAIELTEVSMLTSSCEDSTSNL